MPPLIVDRAPSRIDSVGARFLADRSGGTAIEYGLIASLIVIALIGALHVVGSATSNMHSKIANAVVNNVR